MNEIRNTEAREAAEWRIRNKRRDAETFRANIAAAMIAVAVIACMAWFLS